MKLYGRLQTLTVGIFSSDSVTYKIQQTAQKLPLQFCYSRKTLLSVTLSVQFSFVKLCNGVLCLRNFFVRI